MGRVSQLMASVGSGHTKWTNGQRWDRAERRRNDASCAYTYVSGNEEHGVDVGRCSVNTERQRHDQLEQVRRHHG